MSILQLPVAGEFCVGQPHSAVEELIGANRRRCEKIVCPRRTGEIVLIDAVTTNPDRADEHAVAVQSKCSGKNCDSVRQSRIKPGVDKPDTSRIAMIAAEAGKDFLVPI